MQGVPTTQTVSVWITVVIASCAANLPFVSQQFMGLMRLTKPKTPWIRLAELLGFYLVAGGVGLALEQRVGQIAPQTWAFYAIPVALFLTLAFPGFIYRYLLKHPG